MTCDKCGHLFILFENDRVCPNCNKLAVLDSETAVRVGTRLVELSKTLLNEELRNWERDTLLGNIAAKRELISRQYFKEYSPLNVGRLATLTLLIKRVTKFGNFRGKVPIQMGEIDKLIRVFEKSINFESILLKLKAGYNNILYLNRFNESSFTLEDAKRTFLVVTNETYLNLENTFATHNIFPERIAEKRFSGYKQFNPSDEEQTNNQLLTPQEFIKRNYEILNEIFVLFHRDWLFAKCFELGYLGKILLEPRNLLEFISTFALFEDNTQTVCPTTVFIKRASNYFGIPEAKVKNLLVFDVNNKSIFPLFVRFRGERLGDVVHISKDFSKFIYTILHATMTKDLFDEETVRLSKEFENEGVKMKFKENGYLYIPNITDKKNATLQIDGLAVGNTKCYIIECKGWRFPRLIDEPDTKGHIVRDLKGIVLW